MNRSPLRLPAGHAALLAVTAILLTLGLGWGLPSARRVEILLGGEPLTAGQRELLSTVRREKRERRDASRAEAAEALFRKGEVELAPGDQVSALVPEEDKLDGLCSFAIHSSAADEEKTWSALSAIDPRGMRFEPRYFNYGGAYLYPLGGALFFLKSIGMIRVTNDYAYYLDHPTEMALVYQTGRCLSVLSFLGTLLLLSRLGGRLGGAHAGLFAMLAYLFSTMALNQALVSKPHSYAAFWGLLAVSLLIRHSERGGLRSLALSGAAAGLAVGSSLVAVTLVLLFPIMLAERRRPGIGLSRIALAWGTLAAVFVLTNPYSVLAFRRFAYALAESHSSWGYGEVGLGLLLAQLRQLVTKSFPLPVALIGLPSLILVAIRGRGPIRRLALGALVVAGISESVVGAQRILLFCGPLLCLYTGIGSAWLLGQPRARGGLVAKLGVLALYLPGAVFAVLFFRDAIRDEEWHAPTLAWVQTARLDETSTVGFFGRHWANQPHPTDSPPFPFLKPRLVNMTQYDDAARLPDYVVVGVFSDNRQRWEAHPLRSRYELARDLGYRRSDDWLLGWRERSFSAISAGVYTPKPH